MDADKPAEVTIVIEEISRPLESVHAESSLDLTDEVTVKQEAALDVLYPRTQELTCIGEVFPDSPRLERKETEFLLVCDCDKAVPLHGKAGKDYFVINVGSVKLTRSWHLHNRKDCYEQVSKKIREAHD